MRDVAFGEFPHGFIGISVDAGPLAGGVVGAYGNDAAAARQVVDGTVARTVVPVFESVVREVGERTVAVRIQELPFVAVDDESDGIVPVGIVLCIVDGGVVDNGVEASVVGVDVPSQSDGSLEIASEGGLDDVRVLLLVVG